MTNEDRYRLHQDNDYAEQLRGEQEKRANKLAFRWAALMVFIVILAIFSI